MSLLIDRLPLEVTIAGRSVRIEADYRTSILFEELMDDDSLDSGEKVIQGLQLYYGDSGEKDLVLSHMEESIDKMLWFYRRGVEKTTGDEDSEESEESEVRVFDWEHDADLLYTSFLQQYGIDLQEVQHMHWWRFKALFKGLSEDTELMKIIGYRGMKISSKLPAEQREFYRKMKRIHALPVKESAAIKQIDDILMNGGNLAEFLKNGGV